MILYNEKDGEKVLFIRCSCGTHGIQLMKYDYKNDPSEEIYLSIYTDMFYSKQDTFFQRLKQKIKKIWCIVRNKDYLVDYEVCLRPDDIKDIVKGLESLSK